ncbi:MAG: GTPase Era [Candidatus Rokubacteria bacterium]|nr:GTPase Era [Candidatus Rokubacteria bacterium]
MPDRPGPSTSPEHRSGFVSLVGRPNVGKSTLLNRLLGQKMAIVSPRPQTTRNRITGIKTLPGAQVVFVDTPGLGAPPGRFGEFMIRTALRALEDVDLICLVGEATELALNKVDLVSPKERLLPLIDAYRVRHPFREIVPISATAGTNVDRLEAAILEALPPGPAYYPEGTTTDQPETFFVAEIIREKLFLLTREEVPYASAVRVEELTERPGGELLYIRAVIFVEREPQKAIVIGEGGRMLKWIGQAARRELEAFFGIKVYLELQVRVRWHWRRDERALREFGYLLTS